MNEAGTEFGSSLGDEFESIGEVNDISSGAGSQIMEGESIQEEQTPHSSSKQ
jgi:hypothetical protein